MPVTKRTPAPADDKFKKFKLDPASLPARKPLQLSNAAIAKKLGVKPELLSAAVTLSPNKPRSGKKFLKLYSCMLMMANPLESNNIALFSSAFPGAVSPGLQVEFDPIKAGKKHLVEFNITLNEPQKVYKFRVFQFPSSTFQDISISGQQSISVVVNPFEDISSYGAEIMQLNTKAEACGWILHSVKITSVS